MKLAITLQPHEVYAIVADHMRVKFANLAGKGEHLEIKIADGKPIAITVEPVRTPASAWD